MFRRILVANRGEIAMRIIRCCKDMGIETVAIYSEADLESMHVKKANYSVCIGPANATESYLNKEAIITVAKAYQCDAIHPGFGFLSENAEFAEMCEKEGIVFIGPSAKVISALGDKQPARMMVKGCRVPIVEGSDGFVETLADAMKWAQKIGYPVIIKATAGGGGRGMRIVQNKDEMETSFFAAQAEAESAFGNKAMYMERYVKNPHHVEVQIIGDVRGNVVQLGLRDCSMQRRHQKLLEESPVTWLPKAIQRKMARAAIKAAKAVKYVGVGTVEFLVDETFKFYFIEMNTRIQVEHPVTEMVTGIDIVKEQIRVAYGNVLSFKQRDIKISGHAIECRINAENPKNNFVPSPGKIKHVQFPMGMGVRVETSIYQGYTVSPWYDSMLAKIIVHAENREVAIKRMQAALDELEIEGCETNIMFQKSLLSSEAFSRGNYDTSFIAENIEELL